MTSDSYESLSLVSHAPPNGNLLTRGTPVLFETSRSAEAAVFLSRLSLKEVNVDLSFYEHCMSVAWLTLLIIYTRREEYLSAGTEGGDHRRILHSPRSTPGGVRDGASDFRRK